MSRVDISPTYSFQGLLNLLSQVDVGTNEDSRLFEKLIQMVGNSDFKPFKRSDSMFKRGLRKSDLVRAVPSHDSSPPVYQNLFSVASYAIGLKAHAKWPSYRITSTMTSEFVKAFLEFYNPSVIYSDDHSRYYFMLELYDSPSIVNQNTSTHLTFSTNLAKYILRSQTPYSKLSGPSVNKFIQNFKLCNDDQLKKRYRIAIALERLMRAPINHKFHTSNKREFTRYASRLQTHEWFNLNHSSCCKNWNSMIVRRAYGTWFLFSIKSRVLYIVDRASLDQIRLRAWSLFMMNLYAANYRLTGNEGKGANHSVFRDVMTDGINRFFEYVRYCKHNRLNPNAIPRSMKIGQSRLINDIGSFAEEVDFGGAQRSKSLLASELQELDAGITWSEFLMKCGVTDHQKLDISYIFHLAPCADFNILDLHINTIQRLGNENKCNQKTWSEFLLYVHTTAVMEYVVMRVNHGESKKSIMHSLESSVELESNEWVKTLLKGSRAIPSKEVWGQVKLKRVLPYTKRMESAFLDAKDATHINADYNDVFNCYKDSFESAVDSNEILYTLRYGPLLSKRWTPEEVREAVCEGRLPGDPVVVLAAKAENTKYGKKTRETYSACDVIREMQSELDHNFQTFNQMIVGPSLRKSDASVRDTLMRIGKNQALPSNSNYVFITSSHDISSWSPGMIRKNEVQFFNQVLSYFKTPNNLSFSPVWREMDVCTSRRGYQLFDRTYTGSFMGFPGTADTALHSLICAYVVRRAKDDFILAEDEEARICTTIDDALLEVKVRRYANWDETREKIEKFASFMQSIYGELGFVIDPVKSILSTAKFTYLNRVWLCGSEALTSMKIFSKVNRELTRRYSNTSEQVSAVFNSAYGASERGTDPMVSYYTACILGGTYWAMVDPKIRTFDVQILSLSAMLPVSLGGLGFPFLISWLTKEERDSLSCWFAVMNDNIRLMRDYIEKHPSYELFNALGAVERLAQVVYSLPPKKIRISKSLSAIRSYQTSAIANFSHPEREAMRISAEKLVQHEAIKSAINWDQKEHVSCIIDKLAHNSKLDAAVYELLDTVLPWNALSAIMDKAEKNEIVAMLIGPKQSSRISRQIRKEDKIHASAIYKLWEEFEGKPYWDANLTGLEVASDMRERFYAFNELSIINHSEPAPNELLLHVQPSQASSSKALSSIECLEIASPSRCRRVSLNMYDGRTPYGHLTTLRSKGSFGVSMRDFSMVDPITRKLLLFAVTMKWLSSQGANPDPLWHLVVSLWSDDIDITWQEVSLATPVDISSKRLSVVIGNATHPIAAFPNCLASIGVSITNIGTWMSQNHTRYDYLSIVTTARVCGLMDRALCNRRFGKRYYAMNHRAMVYADPSHQVVAEVNYEDLCQVRKTAVLKAMPFLNENLNLIHQLSCFISTDPEADEEYAMAIFQGAAVSAIRPRTGLRSNLLKSATEALSQALLHARDEIPVHRRIRKGNLADTRKDNLIEPLSKIIDRLESEGKGFWVCFKSALSVGMTSVGPIPDVTNKKNLLNEFDATEFWKDSVPLSKVHRLNQTIFNAMRRLHMSKSTLLANLQIVLGDRFAPDIIHGKTKSPFALFHLLVKIHTRQFLSGIDFLTASIENNRKAALMKKVKEDESHLKDIRVKSTLWYVKQLQVNVRRAIILAEPDFHNFEVIMIAAWEEMMNQVRLLEPPESKDETIANLSDVHRPLAFTAEEWRKSVGQVASVLKGPCKSILEHIMVKIHKYELTAYRLHNPNAQDESRVETMDTAPEGRASVASGMVETAEPVKTFTLESFFGRDLLQPERSVPTRKSYSLKIRMAAHFEKFKDPSSFEDYLLQGQIARGYMPVTDFVRDYGEIDDSAENFDEICENMIAIHELGSAKANADSVKPSHS